MLSSLFKPKWQHRNPQVRKTGVLALSAQVPDQAQILLALAAEDPEPDVRRAAVKRVSELGFLRERAQRDADAGVREVAAARYRQLLAGGMSDVDLAVRLQALAEWPAEDVLAHVARRGREVELRVAALERLDNPVILQDAAINDPVPRVRQVAAGRITDAEVLRRTIKQCQSRDKKVTRLLRDRLAELEAEAAERAERRDQQAAICADIEALAEAPFNETYRAALMRLENRWAAAGPAEAEQERRYQAALERCRQRLKAGAEAASVAPEPVEPALSLEAALDEVQGGRVPTADWLEQLQTAVEASGEDPQAELVRDYLRAARRWLELAPAAESALTGEDQPASLRIVETVRWPEQLPAPRGLADLQALARRKPEPVEPPPEEDPARAKQVDAALDQLEAELDRGRLRQARRQLKHARALLEGLPRRQAADREGRLKRGAARVDELRDWRQFVAVPKQRELCERMEALREAELPPPERAEQVKALQEAWKATGGSDSAESRELWQRFQTAADQAFEPCRIWFDEQARLREQNLAQRERICQQLEEFVAAADWDRLDGTALERIRAQARQEWKAAEPVDAARLRPIRRRFEPLMRQLTEQIDARRQDNLRRREVLVEEARALLEQDDLRAATDEAKRLQGVWRELPSAGRRHDQRLWEQFRAVCDELFGRRDEVRAESRRRREQQVQEAEQLIERARAVLAQPVEMVEAELPGLRRALEDLRLPREAEAQRQALAEIRQSLVQAEAQGRRRQQAQFWEAARQAASLCRARETGADVEELQARWQALGDAVPAALTRRWQRACEGAPAAGLDEAERHALCVQMEIVAGQPSPEADRALRMDLQVRRLNEGLAEGSRTAPREQAEQLIEQWYAAPGPVEPALEERFEQAWRALLRDTAH